MSQPKKTLFVNNYISKLKHHVGSKRFCRLKNIIIYLDEAANITNVFMTYIKNINGVKGEEIKDFPKCSLEVTDEFVGKKIISCGEHPSFRSH